MRKTKFLKEKSRSGITLIALVITIIVLLILAGISIMMLTGDNSILKQATNAKENTLKGTEKEAVTVAYNGVLTKNLGHVEEGDDFKNDLQEELRKNGYNVEVTENGKIVKFKDTKNVYTLDVAKGTTQGPLKEGTIGYAYATGEIEIGSDFKYSANSVNDWIVFGEDESGNVLLASKEPISGKFTLNGTVQAWLNYESYTDETYGLNCVCSKYGKTIQGKEIKSRSITMADINRVTGFDKVLSGIKFDKYTFGATMDYANKKVDYYFPCAEEETSWRKVTEENGKEEKEFYNNWYYYEKDGDTYKYQYEALEDKTTIPFTLSNMEYVTGGNGEYFYPVADSYSISVQESNGAAFGVAAVMDSGFFAHNVYLCASDSDEFVSDRNFSMEIPIRPIVILPSDLLVQKDDGKYKLVEQN